MIRRHIADYKIIDFGDIFDEKLDQFCSVAAYIYIYCLSFGRAAVMDLGIPSVSTEVIMKNMIMQFDLTYFAIWNLFRSYEKNFVASTCFDAVCAEYGCSPD